VVDDGARVRATGRQRDAAVRCAVAADRRRVAGRTAADDGVPARRQRVLRARRVTGVGGDDGALAGDLHREVRGHGGATVVVDHLGDHGEAGDRHDVVDVGGDVVGRREVRAVGAVVEGCGGGGERTADGGVVV